MIAMSITWNDSTPIYRQLRERVVGMILDGVLKPGDPLPSVRQVAGDFQINPITVSKAYQELVDENLVEKRRGLGMYVTEGAPRRCSNPNASASCAKNGRRCANVSGASASISAS
jgi:GntR family transcriptional regulator